MGLHGSQMDKKTITTKPERLDHEAAQYLRKLLADHRHRLLTTAGRMADGKRAITVADLEMARDSGFGGWGVRAQIATAQMHITIANAENRKYEIIAIIMAAALFIFGTTLLCSDALSIQWGMIVTGTIFPTSKIWIELSAVKGKMGEPTLLLLIDKYLLPITMIRSDLSWEHYVLSRRRS